MKYLEHVIKSVFHIFAITLCCYTYFHVIHGTEPTDNNLTMWYVSVIFYLLSKNKML